MVDPQIRLQNIALETQELLQQRSMAWSETTNRSTMLMTVVGASVFALALVGNAVRFDQSFLMFAAVALAVVLLVGLITLGRIGELDVLDWKWVQGLNRLRHARLELDPEFDRYLVTSSNDDADAVLAAYGTESVSDTLHGFYTLWTLIALVNAMIAAFLAADVALIVRQPALIVAGAGVVMFVVVLGLLLVSAYRGYTSAMRHWETRFPTPSQQTDRE